MSPRVFEAQPAPPRAATLKTVDGRTYPLRSARIRARAEGGLAATTLIQEYENPFEEPLEVIYTLPLPADGSVLGYTVTIGERIIRGEIQPREKAEAAYMKALYEGRTAGLLEQDRADTFQQRLGNIPARTGARVEIEVLQPLAFHAGIGSDAPTWEYRFPTVTGVRYQGGLGQVPDSERLDVDRDKDGGIPTRVELDLTIADETARSGQPSSAGHRLACETKEDGVHVRLDEASRLDRDLDIRWAASYPEVGVRVVEGGGLPGDDGRYALITITPPEAIKASYRRDLTVLLDTSGSMDGEPLQIAKRVVARLLESLEEGDRFEVLAFSDKTQKLTNGLINATPKDVSTCIARVGMLAAQGGTEMSQAMAEALHPLREDAQRQVVLVTDGQIGFEREVIETLAAGHRAVARVHAVGVGSAPNRALTHGVARAGRGVELHASDDLSAAEAAARLIAASASPVLVGLTVGGNGVLAVAPERPHDVFAGQPLVMTLELHPSGGRVEAAARLAGSKEQWIWRVEIPKAGGAKGAIATTPLPLGARHGRELIEDVESNEILNGWYAITSPRGRKTIDPNAEIERLGMRHKIVSRRTSLVAIAEEPSVDPKAPRRCERLAVELPAGVSAEGVGLERLGGGLPAVMGRSVDFLYQLRPGMTRGLATFDGPSNLRSGSIGSDPWRIEPSRPWYIKGAFTGGSRYIGYARAVEITGSEAVIEFEAPESNFVLPTGEVTLSVAGQEVGRVQIIEEKSSPGGPHKKGLVVRLAFRLEEGVPWPAGEYLELRWEESGNRVFQLRGRMPTEAGGDIPRL